MFGQGDWSTCPKVEPRAGALSLAAIFACVTGLPAEAQYFPGKPISFIVGFPPGGGADIVARVIGQKLSESVGQPVVIINRPGADSVIGYEYASQAQADGYTLLLVTTEFAINPSLYKNLPYNVSRDFAAVSSAASAPYVLVLHPSIPADSIEGLIALAKAKPGQLTYASSGTGVYLASELFAGMAGISLLRVPYKGGPQAVSDVIGGQISLMFPSMPTGYPHVKSGKLKALAVTSEKRSMTAPALPTIAESGLPRYDAIQWWGVSTRAGVPKEIVSKLNSEIVKALNTPEVKDRLAAQGVDVRGSTSEQFSTFISAEMSKWGKVVKDSGAKID